MYINIEPNYSRPKTKPKQKHPPPPCTGSGTQDLLPVRQALGQWAASQTVFFYSEFIWKGMSSAPCTLLSLLQLPLWSLL